MTGHAPIPVVDDVDTGGFFEGAAAGEVRLRFCTDCDAVLHLPKAYCHRCGSWSTEWRRVAPTGTLYTYTIVEHQVHPAFPAPHALVLVSLDDAPEARLVGSIAGRLDLEIGMAMEAYFDRHGAQVVPNWRPTS